MLTRDLFAIAVLLEIVRVSIQQTDKGFLSFSPSILARRSQTSRQSQFRSLRSSRDHQYSALHVAVHHRTDVAQTALICAASSLLHRPVTNAALITSMLLLILSST